MCRDFGDIRHRRSRRDRTWQRNPSSFAFSTISNVSRLRPKCEDRHVLRIRRLERGFPDGDAVIERARKTASGGMR